jgi:hypothetical protein
LDTKIGGFAFIMQTLLTLEQFNYIFGLGVEEVLELGTIHDMINQPSLVSWVNLKAIFGGRSQ